MTGTDVLGIGNFSIVRKGCDIPTGEAVAVKSLKAASSAKFRREVGVFLRNRGPHVMWGMWGVQTAI